MSGWPWPNAPPRRTREPRNPGYRAAAARGVDAPMAPADARSALPFLESLPYPALWIGRDFEVRWANRAARERNAGADTGKCYRIARGLPVPCASHGEVCPAADARRCGRPANGVHTSLGPGGPTQFRVTAIPVGNSGVIEIHEPLPRDFGVDALTGLALRQSAQAVLERTFRLLQRLRQPLSLIMLDLDRFKLVNDTHGHAAGDAVLEAVGRVLRDGTRGTDFAARWGGEEFLIVLPGTGTDGAMQLAQKVLGTIRALRVPFGNTELRVTASAGVWGHDPATPVHDALARADAALYQAKSDGRDRCAAAPPPGTPASP